MPDAPETRAAEQDDTEKFLAAIPPLLPFRNTPTCAQCGVSNLPWHRFFGVTAFDWSWCPGSRDEKTRQVVVPGLIEAERRNACYGLVEPHIHMRCRRCGFWWLTRTRSR